MTMPDVEFEFYSLSPRDDMGREIYGILIDGTAYLEPSNDPGFGDRHEFYVERIEILGGLGITHKQAKASPTGFNGVLFKAIADLIENSKTGIGQDAQAMFSEAVRDEMEVA